MQIIEREAGDLDRLRELIRIQGGALQRDRLRCVVLALDGETEPRIERMTGRSRGFVQRWAYAYRDGGIEAVRARKRGGSKTRLAPGDTEKFLTRVKAGPTDADGMACSIAGKDCQRILRDEFGVAYSLNGVYGLLHRNGLSCLKPRPRHRKSDPVAQQQWLDRAPLLSNASAMNVPAATWKSGNKMKPGSASKAR